MNPSDHDHDHDHEHGRASVKGAVSILGVGRFGLGGLVSAMLGCQSLETSDATRPTLPRTEACDPTRDWASDHVELELAMLDALDEQRTMGAPCEGIGFTGPGPSLEPDGALWCAARLHALDMSERGYVEHQSPDGSRPWDRVRLAGGRFAVVSEVIARADLDPEAVLEELWLARGGSCSALMASEWTHVGIGHAGAPDGSPSSSTGPRPSSGVWTVVVGIALPRPGT